MNRAFSIRATAMLAAILWLATVAGTQAGAEISTNAAPEGGQLSDELNKHKLTDDLLKPFAHKADNSLEGMIAPPIMNRPTLTRDQIERIKELREKQKNWLFADTEDTTKKSEEWSSSPRMKADDQESGDGKGTKLKSRNSSTNSFGGRNFSARRQNDLGEATDGSASPGHDTLDQPVDAKPKDENPFKKLFTGGEASAPNSTVFGGGYFSPVFTGQQMPAEDTSASDKRPSEFRKLLDSSSANSSASSSYNPMASPINNASVPTASMPAYGGNSIASQLQAPVSYTPLGASSLPVYQPPSAARAQSFDPVNIPRRAF
jgi:hypothetical protein